MSALSAEEMRRRRQSLESVRGTHAMEGLLPDAPPLEIMGRYEQGELTLNEFLCCDGRACLHSGG